MDTSTWAHAAAQPLEKSDVQRMQQSTQPAYLESGEPRTGHTHTPADTLHRSAAHDGSQMLQWHDEERRTHLRGAPAAQAAPGNSAAAWESVQSLLGECVPSRLKPWLAQGYPMRISAWMCGLVVCLNTVDTLLRRAVVPPAHRSSPRQPQQPRITALRGWRTVCDVTRCVQPRGARCEGLQPRHHQL